MLQYMTRHISCFVFVLFIMQWAYAQEPLTAKQKDILKFLELSGSLVGGKQTVDMMLPSLKKISPSVPDKFWDDFVAKLDMNELALDLVTVYDKRFTHDEIKEMIGFYLSPIGRKIIQHRQEISKEAFEIGQQYGMRLGQRVVEELRRQGYK